MLHMRNNLLQRKIPDQYIAVTAHKGSFMFQTFDVTASPDTGRARVQQLRSSFETIGIDCLLVPRSDRFQGEYVPESEARLAWLTGFTGSAGAAVIMQDTAHLFVDGRYTTQVRQQIDLEVFTPQDLVTNPPAKWLLENARTGLPPGFTHWPMCAGWKKRPNKSVQRSSN